MSREAYPDLIQILSDFSTKSFTELQAAAYVALVKMGEESGSAVAGEAGINRSKIYDILGQLEEMGAVKKVSRDGKSRYVAVSPEDLLPKLVEKFKEDIGKAQESLLDIQGLQEEIEEAKITLTTLDLTELDTNVFDYLISSTEKSRVKFTDKLDKDNRPGSAVRILNLNTPNQSRGLIFLLGKDNCYFFGTPTGMRVEALQITSVEMINFLRDMIESAWIRDIPEYVMDEIRSGDRLALAIDKATYVFYEFYAQNQEYKYERPISVVISDSFISFFYEGIEELKIPMQFIKQTEILEDDVTIIVKFASATKAIGDLQMRVVSRPILIRNILQHIIRSKIN